MRSIKHALSLVALSVLPVLMAALMSAVVPAVASAQESPPTRLDFSADPAQDRLERQDPTPQPVRNAFVRDQTILGLGAYGPSFAAMVGDDGVKATAGYLVMAGGTFFAAVELSRRMDMTQGQQLLSTRMAWRGAATALYVMVSPEEAHNQSTTGAVTLLAGLGGTTAGLLVGRGLTPGEAVATTFGHDLAFVGAGLVAYAADPRTGDDRGLAPQSRAMMLTGAGWAGYALGRLYAGRARYNVTAGDVTALWLGTAIGATAAGTAIVETEIADQAIALTMLGGGLAGAWLADRVLVRRYDHSRSEGNMLALGGVAGGLMGVGVGVLVAGEAEREGAVTLGFATLGAATGVLLTERYLQPRGDEGRPLGLGRLEIDPAGLALAATGMRGRHAIARLTF
jgi:hypothetical protein